MKFSLISLVLIFSLNSYAQTTVTPEDLKAVIGEWTGSITYLDYQTNEPFTMPADLIVEPGKNENTLVLNYIYPDEPKANSTDRIRITQNGTLLNKDIITLRKELADGQTQIQTEREGKDDNKDALIRQTYIMGQDQFLMRKEVQFEASEDWIKRSEFSYQRKN